MLSPVASEFELVPTPSTSGQIMTPISVDDDEVRTYDLPMVSLIMAVK